MAAEAASWPGIESIYAIFENSGAGADAAADGTADGAANGADTCASCGGSLCCDVDGLRRTCDACGHVVDGDSTDSVDDAMRPAPGAARLRCVGAGSSSLMPNLFRSGSSDTTETQRRLIKEEYSKYGIAYQSETLKTIPADICLLATNYYNEVQKVCVRRAENKKRIMAACLYYACLKEGYSPSKADIASYMQVEGGIAGGLNFIRDKVADGLVSINIAAECQPLSAKINTIFANIFTNADGTPSATIEDQLPLRAAVLDVVEFADRFHIGTSSHLHSKVASATFEVLRRAALAESSGADLSAGAHAAASRVMRTQSLDSFCSTLSAFGARETTLKRFLIELAAYHSKFAPIYKKHGINSDNVKPIEVQAQSHSERPPRAAKAAAVRKRVPKKSASAGDA